MGTPITFGKWRYALFVLFMSSCFFGYSQNGKSLERSNQRLGFNYGQGTQQSFPFQSDSYTYDIVYFKLNYNLNLAKLKKFDLGLTIEPGIYFSEEGEFAAVSSGDTNLKTTTGKAQLEDKPALMEYRKMNEYVLNIGLQMSYPFHKSLDGYLLGSIGPMILNTETSRQKKGFAFSDILAVGFLYHLNNLSIDLRYGVRHVSNASFGYPNKGYNSTNFEMGISFPLQKGYKKNSHKMNQYVNKPIHTPSKNPSFEGFF